LTRYVAGATSLSLAGVRSAALVVAGFAVDGLAVAGFCVDGFCVDGFCVDGCVAAGLAGAGFVCGVVLAGFAPDCAHAGDAIRVSPRMLAAR
jgi:hypothetical protein